MKSSPCLCVPVRISCVLSVCTFPHHRCYRFSNIVGRMKVIVFVNKHAVSVQDVNVQHILQFKRRPVIVRVERAHFLDKIQPSDVFLTFADIIDRA